MNRPHLQVSLGVMTFLPFFTESMGFNYFSLVMYFYVLYSLIDDNITCYSCGGRGHKKAMCPTPRRHNRGAPNKWRSSIKEGHQNKGN